MAAKTKIFLLILIGVLLYLPLLQTQLNFFDPIPLKGAIAEVKKPVFKLSTWFAGEFSDSSENYLNNHFGFRESFIRLNNEMLFRFFNKAKAKDVIIGKEGYLFEKNYIKAFNGDDFKGYDSLQLMVNKLKFLQDTLKKLNKDLLIVLAAGKGTYFSEYFPEKYAGKESDQTNYKVLKTLLNESQINTIDFNDYFLKIKHTAKYPLYPQYGIHWSSYSMCLAADSIISYIEKLRNIHIPHLKWDSISIEQPKESDYDIGDGMNLMHRLKSYNMAYPKVYFENDIGKTKPSVLVISDSYYWGMFNLGISENAFRDSHFWYYNYEVYPDSYKSPLIASAVNLKDEIRKRDVIIIMATEANLSKFGWGFIDRAYETFSKEYEYSVRNPEFMRKVNSLIEYIRTDKKWLEDIKLKADKNGVSLDSMLFLDATWQIKNVGR
ncbi:MAG: hypothetical protein DYH00_00090 [Bacteroidetes bacterium CHB6]|nr:hypothetical protein [Bacteroidetes bacterium CHB6]